MAEQILHGSECRKPLRSKAVANEWRRVRVWRASAMPACSTATFEGALKGLVIHVMATHDTAPWIGRMRAAQNPEPRPNARRADTSAHGVGSVTPLRPSARSFSHHACASRQLLAQAGCQLPATSRPDPWSSLLLPHDDRAVIEIQILTRSCKPSLIRMPVPYRKLGEQTMLAFQKTTRMRNHFHPGQHHRQAPRRPRSSDLPKPWQIQAQHLAVEEQQGRQCLTMRETETLRLFASRDRNASTSLPPKVAG